MTDLDHIERVRKLAEQARAWEDQVDPYSEEGRAKLRETINHQHGAAFKALADGAEPRVCTCQTCGVANARIRGALAARGWSHAATHHVRVEGFDFRGGCDPYIAVVKVDGNEIHRAYSDLAELLDSDVLDRIEAAMRRCMC